MNYRNIFFASAVALTASTAAFAAPINLATLDYNGSASSVGSTANLTQVNATMTGGAVYSANALATPTNFSTTFSFNVGAQSTGLAGNGFAFVLTTTPQSMGLSSKNLGLGGSAGGAGTTVPVSLDVQFSTIANPTNNPLDSNGNHYSNLVAISTDGNLIVPQNATTAYGAPYGVAECNNLSATKSSSPGCMANGGIWSATISYSKGLLTVSVTDPSENGPNTVITGYAINLASLFGSSPVFAGFSASNGAVTETTTIDSWSLSSSSVPEPASLAMFGAGLAALGYTVRRRRAV
jgi:hypothetical protein